MNPNSVEAKREQLVKLNTDAQALIAKATAEARDLTEAEKKTVDSLTAQFQAADQDIKRAELLEAQNAALAQVQPRKTASAEAHRSPIVAADDSGNWGFKHVGEFLQSVRNAKSGYMDPRLVKNAATTYSGEGANADGGFALPPDFRVGVQKLMNTPDNLFALLDTSIVTPNFTVTVPVDETPPWTTTGIAAAVVAEGVAPAQKKPILKQVVTSLSKYGVLAPVSYEMLSDGTQIAGYLQNKCADAIRWQLNAATFTALTGSGSKLTTPKNGEAVSAPANITSIQKMFYNAWVNGWGARGVWLVNPFYLTVLQNYVLGQIPVFMPAGGMSNAPYATLFGRPVIFSELCTATGTEGDIVFFVPDTIYGISKSDGLRVDVSTEWAFDQDVVAYRFFQRAAVKSKFSAVITRPDATTASNIVTLAVR